MSNLVQVPWQPTLYLTPDTLDLLIRAGNRLGVKLYIYMAPDGPTDGAWRSWDRQNFLYQKALAGGNVASNPNSGQRMHMRGGAFDLVRTDAAVQAACRAVGLIRDGVEKWHWNNPRMTSMPIIPTLTGTAGGNTTPIGDTEVVTSADVEAIAQRTAKVILREFWIGDGPPMNRPLDITLYDILTDGEATRAAVESMAPRVGAPATITDAQIAAIAAAVASKIPTATGGLTTAQVSTAVVDALKSVTYKAV